jgi:hypothetical protein
MSSGAFLFCGAKRMSFYFFFAVCDERFFRPFFGILTNTHTRARALEGMYNNSDSFCLLFLLHDTNALFSMLDFIA